MKVSDLADIPDSVQRLIQSQKFLVALKQAEDAAASIRDAALLDVRDALSQGDIAALLGVSQQRVSQMEKKASLRAAHVK